MALQCLHLLIGQNRINKSKQNSPVEHFDGLEEYGKKWFYINVVLIIFVYQSLYAKIKTTIP